ncbi:MAG: hypothetical protein GY765_13255 [bacterium]|nr:hypothetical protein [bacterium]
MNKLSIQKTMCCLLAMLFLSVNVFGIVWGNDSEKGYDETEGTEGTEAIGRDSACLKHYVVEGAGYLLKSYSYIFALLHNVEMSEIKGPDYGSMYWNVTLAADNMKKAGDTYGNLVRKAASTPYNPEVTRALGSFDYTGFQEKKGLNSVIFQEAACWLKKGDVLGIYKQMAVDIESILYLLKAVKSNTDVYLFPNLEDIRQLSRKCSESMLFGQYVALVFNELDIVSPVACK